MHPRRSRRSCSLTAKAVRRIAEALAAVGDDELRRRFSPDDMMARDIYPSIWDRDPRVDDTLGYLMEYVAVLRTALATVVSRGDGLMLTRS